MAQIVGAVVVWCPTAREVIIWLHMLGSSSEPVLVFNFSITDRTSLGPESSEERAREGSFGAVIYVVTHSIVDAACSSSRVRFSGRGCSSREGNIEYRGSGRHDSGRAAHVENCIVCVC